MDKKEVFGLITAVIVACLLVSLVKLVRRDSTTDEGSMPSATTPISPVEMATTKTDYWDYLHSQQTTSAEETDETGISGTADENETANGTEIGTESGTGGTDTSPSSQSEQTGTGTMVQESTATMTESAASTQVTAYTLFVP